MVLIDAPIFLISQLPTQCKNTLSVVSPNLFVKYKLTSILAFGQGKLSEKQFFAAKYRMHCILSTITWLMWSMWLYNDKYDHVAFLVKTGCPPKV